MKKEPIEVIRGSGNVFRDLGQANADLEQLKAILAAQIIKLLDAESLSVRKAQARTGIAAADDHHQSLGQADRSKRQHKARAKSEQAPA
jgi:hypothetical protein